MDNLSWLNTGDPEQIEELYQQYKTNPEAVEESWRMFFKGFDFARTDYSSKPKKTELLADEFKVINLINSYRQRGHLFTKTNPVRTRRKYSPDLSIENFGLLATDLNKKFEAGNEIGIGAVKLSEII